MEIFSHQAQKNPMYDLTAGDLVWIPADTLIEYQSFIMSRTKVPTYGLVLDTQNNLCNGHATILRNDERVLINIKYLRKINPTEEINDSISRGY